MTFAGPLGTVWGLRMCNVFVYGYLKRKIYRYVDIDRYIYIYTTHSVVLTIVFLAGERVVISMCTLQSGHT